MTIALSPQIEVLVRQKIARGGYNSVNDLLEIALNYFFQTTDGNSSIENKKIKRLIDQGFASGEPKPLESAQVLIEMAKLKHKK